MAEFDEMFQVSSKDVADLEIGKVYPFFGMITKILSEDVDGVVTKVEINYNIQASLQLNGETALQFSNTLKNRVLESGIFLCEFLGKTEEGILNTKCNTMVFGRQPIQN